ncbi:MAG TPA: AI-2E family transporter [Polyangiaceae bacterium]|jgi:predicted PurR-regulated permease PerM|nr:AI-2E family transporter [Polyangiaceae bacterium]
MNTTLRTMNVLAVALGVATFVVFAPFLAPLVLAAWLADLFQPATARLERVLGGRRRAAGALVALVAIGVLLPLAGIAATLASGVDDLLKQLRAALEGRGSLASALLGGDESRSFEMRDWAGLLSRYGANAWHAIGTVARASATAALGVVVFIAALYTFTVDGQRTYAWLEARIPISPSALGRLARAFRSTGRGLLVAMGGTSFAQGALATVAYYAVGIPRALVLGPLTAVCALVPLVGTALVWVPLSLGLAARGEYVRAGVLAAIGACVLSTVDNVLRPFLARYGRIDLPVLVVFLSMLGGLATFGAVGLLVGPLLARLCVEALSIAAEERAQGTANPAE